ncbi:MAG: hypothetical protein O6766_04830, partial [Gammaproteobacteria bacterium]|nr:hypothetical protein [Gammaproteobacteria bacterium]
LKEIPDNVKETLTIYPVKWMDDVLAIALVSLPEPLVEERASATQKELAADPEGLPEVASTDVEQPINPH